MPVTTRHHSNDTTVLPEAVKEGLNSYIGKPTVNEAIQSLGGNKSRLAQELAGTSDKSSTAYHTQMKNIDRWMRYEKGERGKQARNAQKSPSTIERLQNVMRPQVKPGGMNISITGLIAISGDTRKRTINIDTSQYSIDIDSMLRNVASDDITSAYEEIFSSYARGMMVLNAEDIDVRFR